ncbi:MAG: hypothetical protein AXW11_18840 [Marinobacter sp. Hex_13]|nr:MAG: hypothetical protein AXW11_18840 [Marinobacter sp. Hex_13]
MEGSDRYHTEKSLSWPKVRKAASEARSASQEPVTGDRDASLLYIIDWQVGLQYPRFALGDAAAILPS